MIWCSIYITWDIGRAKHFLKGRWMEETRGGGDGVKKGTGKKYSIELRRKVKKEIWSVFSN